MMAAGPNDLIALLVIEGLSVCTASDLARSLNLSSASITVLIDRLAAAQLVERRPNPEDRRGVVVHLTAKGGAVVHTITDVLKRDLQVAIAGASDRQRRQLAKFLDTLATRQWERSEEVASPGSGEAGGA
jgi:DNA-binding MarR family transcriptional regulator